MTVRAALAVVILGLGLLAPPLAAEAQPAARVGRIGYLATGVDTTTLKDAFRQGLRDLAYVEGRDVVIEYRDAGGRDERLPALAADLVAQKVDVIVAVAGTLPALAARRATTSVPVVFIGAGDPVTSGLVASLARPGGNVTGLSAISTELVGKWLELLREAVPGVRRVAVLWQPGALGERTDREVLNEAEVAARALGLQLRLVEGRGAADLERAFSEICPGGPRPTWTRS